MRSDILTIGDDGRLARGKEYAGREFHVKEQAPGVWEIQAGTFIANNERGLHESPVRETIAETIASAERHPRREADLDELEEKLLGGE